MIGLRPPSFPLLRDSQSQRLSLQVGESSWTLLPTGAVVSSQDTSSSPYRAFRRPEGVMSRYTARENQRLKQHFERFRSAKPPNTRRDDLSPPVRTPTDSDFQRLIDRLQKAQSGFRGNKRLVLVEDRVESCRLDQDDVQYMRVAVLNQPAPLRVVFRRSRGRLVAFVSRTVPEPSEALADAIVYRDVVKVMDTAPKFKCEVVYLAVKALSPSIFTVNVHFGKPELTRSDTAQPNKDRHNRSQEEIMWEMLENSIQSRSSPNRSVNHIKQNLVILPPASPVRRAAAKLRKKATVERRKSALVRKQSFIQEQRQRKYMELHRQETRLLELEQERSFQRLRSRKAACEKDWIRAIAWAKAAKALFSSYQIRKAEVLLEVKKGQAAVLIQAHVRRLTRGVGRPGIALRHCRNALLVYSRLTAPAFLSTVRLKLAIVLREARELSVVPKAMRTTLKAGKMYGSYSDPTPLATVLPAPNRTPLPTREILDLPTRVPPRNQAKSQEAGNFPGTINDFP